MFHMFDDYCSCSVHIDNHTGDWEAKSSRRNRNHSVCGARLSQNNITKSYDKKLKIRYEATVHIQNILN